MATPTQEPTYTAYEAHEEHFARLAEMVESWVLDEALSKLIAATEIVETMKSAALKERQRETAERVYDILIHTLEPLGGERLRDSAAAFSDFALAFDPAAVTGDAGSDEA